jgi:serine-type D-Ala-D-Ala carboxypeptidase/endopeptidase
LLAWSVVRDEETAAGGFGGAGPETVFQIGSVTKVLTALLLADMAERAEVHLSDPATSYLPEPSGDGPSLADLATHTSGLPRLPRGLLPSALLHPTDPYARYPVSRLVRDARRALRAASSAAPAPHPYAYSNFGFGLLGYLLGRAAGTSYETLVTTRICAPLALPDTTFVPAAPPDTAFAPPAPVRVAQGHRRGRPVRDWRLGALAGAGGLYSTAADLARFLRACLTAAAAPGTSVASAQALGPAIRTTLTPHRSIPGGEIGLAWHLARRGDRTIAWHNGMTGGFSAMVALDLVRGLGVAALANTAGAPPSPLDRAVLSAFGS